ncbi:MAG: acetolactate synthase large subunit [Blastocatellia bacterium]
MNGAESLLQTAVNAGIDTCFANPGTTEMPLVQALDSVNGIRAVLCMFEGVCTGAADGYARMTGKPALTLLHLGPGFANGFAYLHDARRARSPVVNLIGDHASWHLAADAPLTTDIESLARPVSHWLRKSRAAGEMPGDMAEAIAVASVRPGRISTLILPHDFQMEPAGGPATLPAINAPAHVSDQAIDGTVRALRGARPTTLFLGGLALDERGQRAAARIAAMTGCHLMHESFPGRMDRGAGLPVMERLAYFPEQGQAQLRPYQTVILAGARSPVTFFGYPGVSSYFISDEQETVVLSTQEEDSVAALEAVADTLGADPNAGALAALQRPGAPSGPLTPETVGAAICALQPDGAVVMEEAITSGGGWLSMSVRAPRHSYLAQGGGAIGLGPACATGAAIGAPNRPVINFQADGSAMYTIQSLWTQAREQLNVTTLICNNRSYRILGVELRRAGVTEFGPQAKKLIGLANPAIDWVSLANGLGVPGARVDTAEALLTELGKALAEPGPHLIEMMM